MRRTIDAFGFLFVVLCLLGLVYLEHRHVRSLEARVNQLETDKQDKEYSLQWFPPTTP